MYSIIRYFIFIILFFVGIIILKKFKLLKKKSIVFLFTTTLLLIVISGYIPVENVFVKFQTIESMYKYLSFNDIEYIINGDKTSLVIGSDVKNRNSKEWYIALKTDNGYKINVRSADTAISMTEECSISLITDKKTDDTYIKVESNEPKPLELEDNHNSEFVMTDVNPVFGYEYTAFAGNIDENYQLIVNGVTYKLKNVTKKTFDMVPVQ